MVASITQATDARLSFPTLAAMRAHTDHGLKQGTPAVLLGNTAVGDRPPTVYYWDTSSTATEDVGKVLKLTGSATGRFLRGPEPRSPLEFATAADGATDDATELQASIDATESDGVLELDPSKTYKCNSTLTISNPITIRGHGATIDFSSLAAGTGLDFQTSDWNLLGVTLTGPGNAAYSSGSIAVKCVGTNNDPSAPTYRTNYLVQDCTINGWGDAGLYFRYGRHVKVINNKITSIGYSGIGSWAMDYFEYSGNHIETIGPGASGNSYNIICSRFMDAAYSETSEPRCSRGVIANNFLADNPLWEAIDSKGGEQLFIHNNHIYGVYRGMILASSQDGTGGGAEDLAFRDSIISNNILIATSTSASGTHDGSADSAALSDSTASWTTNEWVGYRIYNETDGSSGNVTANTDTTVTATLSGGAEDDWDAGDTYKIERHGEGIFIQGAFNAAQTSVVQYAANNRIVNNYLYRFGINNSSTNGAIKLEATKNCEVDGNTIIEPLYTGVMLGIFNQGANVVNNTVKDPWTWDSTETSGVDVRQRTNQEIFVGYNKFIYDNSALDNPAKYSVRVTAEKTGTHERYANGTDDASSSNATKMTDSGESFTTDEWVGYELRNISDGSKGTVTSNDANSITCSGGLSGGTLDVWNSGDNWELHKAGELYDSGGIFTADQLVGGYARNLTDGSQALITANGANTATASLAGGTDNEWQHGDSYAVNGVTVEIRYNLLQGDDATHLTAAGNWSQPGVVDNNVAGPINGLDDIGSPANGDWLLIEDASDLNKKKKVSIGNLPTGSGMSNFTLAGDSGGGQTITDGNTVTIAGGSGITTTDSATDKVTVAVDSTVVTKVGTPVNNQVGVWTGDGTIEGDAQLVFESGKLGIGLSGGTPNEELEVLGAIQLSTHKSTDTNTSARIIFEHYSGGLTEMAGVLGESQAATNRLFFGGGSGDQYAATEQYFYTAANNTTATGSIVLTLSSSQNATFENDLTVKGNLELGASGDATVARAGIGVISVEGVNVPLADASVDVDGIQMLERADHPNAPAATKGQLWVKNTTPATLIFTDDAGTDTTLGSGGGGLNNVVEDTTPQLGGALDVNGNEITGAIDLHSSGDIIQELGDNAGVNKVSIKDSDAIERAYIDSDGKALLAQAHIGNADTTLDRIAAGRIQLEGVEIATASNTLTFTNKTFDADASGNSLSNVDLTADVINTLPVANGGTGATTLTDGGVLLGSGTGAVTAMAVLADGEMIVGDGTTDPVAESGATLRTSIGCDDAANLTTGTIPAARVGTDHIDAMTEIASAIKTGSGSTLMTTRTGVYRHMWISAGAMVAAASGSAATGTKDDGTNVQFDYFAFDGTANEDLWFDWAMPVEWDGGTIKAKFFWIPASGASASDGVTLELSAVAVGDDDAWDAAMGTAVHVDDTVTAGTSGDLHITAATAAITIGGSPTAGELVSFYVQRLATDAADTMAEDLWLRGIMIQYQESATEPSAW